MMTEDIQKCLSELDGVSECVKEKGDLLLAAINDFKEENDTGDHDEEGGKGGGEGGKSGSGGKMVELDLSDKEHLMRRFDRE